ncbi:Nudt22 [Symbiodinium natans]|uniref:Nudt22 protein n=1 Tax=Symbiodinium natans TaxID=878477 RepID=A0A812NRL2_9DINO|nr:Nudt22 [Symbiodinium natans]
MFMAGQLVQKAKPWATSASWREARCEVLATGVSCLNSNPSVRSTCSGYKAGSMPLSEPPVFPTEMMAVCPGAYWCSKEQETCTCQGEITYATELFTGETYTVPEAEQKYKVVSNGTWLCGTDQSGRPFADPAPYKVKHCWCTPKGILDIVQQHGGGQIEKKKCSEIVTDDFNRFSPRRLQRRDAQRGDGGGVSAPVRKLPAEIFAGEEYDYRYTPWALVTVEDSDYGMDSVTPVRQLRCAYEYGIPLASTQVYKGHAPYDGDVWVVEDIAKRWGREASRTCWVRESTAQACAIALEQPGHLLQSVGGKVDRWLFHLLPALGICLVFTTIVGLQYWRQRQDESDSSSSDQEVPLTR